MGTRGVVGFSVGKDLKLNYNQFDMYPSGVGSEVLDFIHKVCKENKLALLESNAKGLIMVKSDSKPSVADQNYYLNKAQTANLGVSNQKADDWYCLLRECQGVAGLEAVLEGYLKHMVDSSDFANDSLFCEWGYVLDMDKQVLEVYEGFQKKQHKMGRFAGPKPKGWKPEYKGQSFYYPVKLVLTLDFKDIEKDYEAAKAALLKLEEKAEDAA